MAITAALLTSGADAVDASSFVTASISPTNGELIFAAVLSGATTPATPTLSGLGVTWVQVASVAASNNDRITLFRAQGTYTAGTVTIAFGGQTQTHCHWHFAAFAGTATGGTDGSEAVVQSSTSTGSAANGASTSLSAFGDGTNHATIVLASVNANDASFDVEAGFTSLSETVAGARRSLLGWRVGEDTTPGAVWSTVSRVYTIGGAEVQDPPSGTTYQKAGAAVTAAVAAGPDVFEAVETGSAVSAGVAAAADVFESAETGTVTTAAATAGADVFEATETGVGISAAAAAGTDVVEASETGVVVSAAAAAAADVLEAVETGAAVSAAAVSGTDVFAAAETGAAVTDAAASGPAVKVSPTVYEKTGAVVVAADAAGVSTLISTQPTPAIGGHPRPVRRVARDDSEAVLLILALTEA